MHFWPACSPLALRAVHSWARPRPLLVLVLLEDGFRHIFPPWAGQAARMAVVMPGPTPAVLVDDTDRLRALVVRPAAGAEEEAEAAEANEDVEAGTGISGGRPRGLAVPDAEELGLVPGSVAWATMP